MSFHSQFFLLYGSFYAEQFLMNRLLIKARDTGLKEFGYKRHVLPSPTNLSSINKCLIVPQTRFDG